MPSFSERVRRAQRHLQKDGVVVIPRVFSPLQAAAIKRHAYESQRRAVALTLAELHGDIIDHGGGCSYSVLDTLGGKRVPYLHFMPQVLSQELTDVMIGSKMVEMVRQFVGEDAKYNLSNMMHVWPGAKRDTGPHQDDGALVYDDPMRAITVFIALEDQIDNGPEVFLGSHRDGVVHSPTAKRLQRYESKRLVLAAGDVAIWCQRTIHGAGSSKTSKASPQEGVRLTWGLRFYHSHEVKAAGNYSHPDFLIDGEVMQLRWSNHNLIREADRLDPLPEVEGSPLQLLIK